MNRLLNMLLLAFFLGSVSVQAQDWAQMSYFKTQNDSIKDVSDQIEVVFMGNSITQGWLSMRPEFFQEHGFVNRGIGGQTTPQMLLRFRQDVIDLNPRIAVILAGINDIAENTGPISLTEIADNIESMVQLAQANGVVPVICSVLPANSFPWRQRIDPTEKVIELNGLLKQMANTYKLPYVDYYSAMVDTKKGLKSDWGYDPVHPNEAGYAVMEPILLSILNNLD
ncbi:MAG: GDSL-type esterase/lipase family protein [Flavobacteriaceae bacterium]